ncbi:MAG: hypothetical protein L6R41_008194 [Letrouitia leprolyta]|nr:MAG: hypothetical protein L6R41_008194 [Letrouitia leprolyta]
MNSNTITIVEENFGDLPTRQTCFIDLATKIRLQIYGYLVRAGDRLLIEDMLIKGKEKNYKCFVTKSYYPFRQLSTRLRSSSVMAQYTISHISGRRWCGDRPQLFTNILLLNMQIHNEASDCLHGQRLQFYCSPDGVEAFLNDRTADTLRHTRNITILVPSENGRMKFDSLCKLIAETLPLERLTVQLNTFMWEHQPFRRVQDTNGSAKDLWELDWIKSLLQIQNLKTFKIEFDGQYAAKRLTVGDDLTRILRERMVSS